MIKVWVYSGIYILGVIISALAQILLKKSANIERENKIKEYFFRGYGAGDLGKHVVFLFLLRRLLAIASANSVASRLQTVLRHCS